MIREVNQYSGTLELNAHNEAAVGADPLQAYRTRESYSASGQRHTAEATGARFGLHLSDYLGAASAHPLTHFGNYAAASWHHNTSYYGHGKQKHKDSGHWHSPGLERANRQTSLAPDGAALADFANRPTYALAKLAQRLASSAANIAREIGTVGNCALGPRLTFDKVGLHLPAVVATVQGQIIEHSGLFHQVPRSQVRPGDYAYRHWSRTVIRQHDGVDKGDAFIVARVGARGELYGANDHSFVVPEDGRRYRNTKFFRPNADFLERVKYAAVTDLGGSPG